VSATSAQVEMVFSETGGMLQ